VAKRITVHSARARAYTHTHTHTHTHINMLALLRRAWQNQFSPRPHPIS